MHILLVEPCRQLQRRQRERETRYDTCCTCQVRCLRKRIEMKRASKNPSLSGKRRKGIERLMKTKQYEAESGFYASFEVMSSFDDLCFNKGRLPGRMLEAAEPGRGRCSGGRIPYLNHSLASGLIISESIQRTHDLMHYARLDPRLGAP